MPTNDHLKFSLECATRQYGIAARAGNPSLAGQDKRVTARRVGSPKNASASNGKSRKASAANSKGVKGMLHNRPAPLFIASCQRWTCRAATVLNRGFYRLAKASPLRPEF